MHDFTTWLVGSSAVVSAPTSSGETFISSYVIQKVLDADDKAVEKLHEGARGGGIVVMVLPTKALVHQVAAQVSERNRAIPLSLIELSVLQLRKFMSLWAYLE